MKLDLALHIASPLVLLFLTVVLYRRRTHIDFPLFFAYILYVPIATALRISVSGKPAIYFWLYWATQLIYGVIEVLVIREVFHRIFSFSHKPHRIARSLFPVTVVLMLALTVWQAIFHPLGHGVYWEVNAIYWFDLCVHFLEGIILLLLLSLRWLFPFKWRQYELGILAGFGVAAGATVFAYIPRFVGGPQYEIFFRYGPPVGYIVATVIWLLVFVQPPEEQPKLRMDLDDALAKFPQATRFVRKLGKWPWRKRLLIVEF
jgi:hypothetical protein